MFPSLKRRKFSTKTFVDFSHSAVQIPACMFCNFRACMFADSVQTCAHFTHHNSNKNYIIQTFLIK